MEWFFLWHLDLCVCKIPSQMEEFIHIGGQFSISKKFQKKKILFQNHMNWNILQRWNIVHLGEIIFRHLDLRVCKIWAPYEGSGNFSTLVENFPLHKKDCFWLQNCMNWNILQRRLFSEKSENFPLFPKTRKFGKFIYSGLQLDKVSATNRTSPWTSTLTGPCTSPWTSL